MERCTYKKGNKMDFLRPDGEEIEINSKEEAADYIRKSCDDCKKYDYRMYEYTMYTCPVRSYLFCMHMRDLLLMEYSEKAETMVPNVKDYLLYKEGSKYMQNLPEYRIKHSKGVADFLYSFARTNYFDNFRCQSLYLAGLLHDIGYYENPTGEDHGRKGAELLEVAGISKDFCDLIRYHGKYIQTPSRDQELMWLADLCINGKGEYIGYRKRFQSICERYENDLDCLMNVQKIVNHLDQYYLEYR